jgi:hypothetical protein
LTQVNQILIRNNQHYALICTTPLFYVLAPTCFGSSLPSSGSIVDPSELLEIQIEWAVYHITCGLCAGLSWFRLLCLPNQRWLRTGRSGDRIPVGARFFAHVQIGSGAHPASCTMRTESFPGVNRPGRGADHPPLLAPRLRKSRAVPLSPRWAFRSVAVYLYLYLTNQSILSFFSNSLIMHGMSTKLTQVLFIAATCFDPNMSSSGCHSVKLKNEHIKL